MKKISTAFAFVFSDDDWFNKVLVGGFYLLLSPIAIGLVMLMGFQVELSRRFLKGEHDMPMWRNSSVIVQSGAKLFFVSLSYAAVILLILTASGVQIFSLITVIVLAVSHFILNPLLVKHFSIHKSVIGCLNPVNVAWQVRDNIIGYLFTISITTLFIGLAVLFGWMFIVVGWPLLIFLSMIVQTVMFAQN